MLDISIEEAAVTCDAFHMAFSDEAMRNAIFDVIDELDRSAARKGEPAGLIINYTVELGMDGIRIGRYADEIPAGEIVELTPPHRANILLRIVDNFPTQEFLGPLIVNRPELAPLAKEAWQTDVFCRADGVVCLDKAGPSVGTRPERGGVADTHTTQYNIPTGLPSHWPRTAIPLGPIRLKFNERFLFLSGARSRSQLNNSTYVSRAGGDTAPARPLLTIVSRDRGQSTSGLSPPRPSENLGHSERKMFHGPLAYYT